MPFEGHRAFFCPGCRDNHVLRVEGDETPKWGYNGNEDSPTFTPSILARRGPNGSKVCHSFVTDGQIRFLDDCTHALAGKTVTLPDIKEG